MRSIFQRSNRHTRSERELELMAADLENALHQLLRRAKFKGGGHIRVSVRREAAKPTYVIEIDSGAARTISKALAKTLQLLPPGDSSSWQLDAANATAIIVAGQ